MLPPCPCSIPLPPHRCFPGKAAHGYFTPASRCFSTFRRFPAAALFWCHLLEKAEFFLKSPSTGTRRGRAEAGAVPASRSPGAGRTPGHGGAAGGAARPRFRPFPQFPIFPQSRNFPQFPNFPIPDSRESPGAVPPRSPRQRRHAGEPRPSRRAVQWKRPGEVTWEGGAARGAVRRGRTGLGARRVQWPPPCSGGLVGALRTIPSSGEGRAAAGHGGEAEGDRP